MRSLAPIVALLIAAGAAHASPRSIIVFPDGSGQYATIQEAVDAATTGTEILLADGTFRGEGNAIVDYKGKTVTIRSLSGNRSACVIEGDSGPTWCSGGFAFVTGEGSFSVLADVTLRYCGGWTSYGCWPLFTRGAISCEGSSPTIRNVELVDGYGGIEIREDASPHFENVRVATTAPPAVIVENASATLVGCVLESNTSVGTGPGGVGAIAIAHSDALLEDCRIEGNGGNVMFQGGVSIVGGSTTLRECVIANNHAAREGGLYAAQSAYVTLERCTITRNDGEAGGVGIGPGASVTLDRTILWGNCGTQWDEARILPGGLLTSTCSDIRAAGVGGGGTYLPDADTIDNAPMFCGPHLCGLNTGGWYAVDEDSEAITAACGPIGALASECDIGVEAVSWGRLKALYR